MCNPCLSYPVRWHRSFSVTWSSDIRPCTSLVWIDVETNRFGTSNTWFRCHLTSRQKQYFMGNAAATSAQQLIPRTTRRIWNHITKQHVNQYTINVVLLCAVFVPGTCRRYQSRLRLSLILNIKPLKSGYLSSIKLMLLSFIRAMHYKITVTTFFSTAYDIP